MVIANRLICKLLNVRAITLWPFIIVKEERDKYDKFLINHEMIHMAQIKELYIIPFYILYVLDYLRYRFKGFGHTYSYRMICFERECFLFQRSLTYLRNRKPYQWLDI